MGLPEISASNRLIFNGPVGCSSNWQGLVIAMAGIIVYQNNIYGKA